MKYACVSFGRLRRYHKSGSYDGSSGNGSYVPPLLLDSFNFWREEFYRAAADVADHVVMRAAVVLMFISHHAVGPIESHLAGEATFGQQLTACGKPS